MNRILSAFCAYFLISTCIYAQPDVVLTTFATGFDRPVDISHAGDSRLFITEQDGKIFIVDTNGTTLSTPFLDIDARVRSTGNEQGLLGLAFHPNYANNGYFYVNYTNNSGDTHISRFSVSGNNPDVADPNSELVVMNISQPATNHNAGDLEFGFDGYLYFGLGDGGSGGDPWNNAQNPQQLLGKMIRIDVDNGSPYSIPPDNPFANSNDTLNEIWAFGLRNPWRFAFDQLTGDLWIADVGQDDWEEINFVPASSMGGEHYGWKCFEGNAVFSNTHCNSPIPYTMPIFVYANNFNTGCSVTGGFVYRGTDYPDMYGYYIFADYCSGRFWSIRYDSTMAAWQTNDAGTHTTFRYSTFGEDQHNELYVGGLDNGVIYRVGTNCGGFDLSLAGVNEICEGDANGSINLSITGGTTPFSINWSNGMTSQDLTNIPSGTYTVTVTDANGCTLTRTLTIAADNMITPPSISSPNNQTVICDGSSIELMATPAPMGYGYQWYNGVNMIAGATDSTFEVTGVGGYYVEYTGGPCSPPISNIITITTQDSPDAPMVTNSTSSDTLCPDMNLNLTASSAPIDYSYQWYENGVALVGETAQSLMVNSSGMYQVQYTGECPSDLSATQDIFAAPALTLMLAQVGDSLTANASANVVSYQWFVGGVLIPDATSASYTPTESGLYAVTVVDEYGCSTTSEEFNFIYSALEDILASGLAIYPNPAAKQFIVQFDLRKQDKVLVQITDAAGKIAYSETRSLPAGTHKWPIHSSALSNGIYTVRFSVEAGDIAQKLIISD